MRRFMRKKTEDADYYIQDLPFTDAQEKKYLTVVANYIRYYGQRARKCKIQYYTLSVLKFLTLGAIPVIESAGVDAFYPWASAGAAAVSILMESIMGLWHIKTKWTIYRDTYNSLLREQRKYAVKRQGFCRQEFDKFCDTIENIIKAEAQYWKENVRSSGKKEKDTTE